MAVVQKPNVVLLGIDTVVKVICRVLLGTGSGEQSRGFREAAKEF